MKKAIFCLVLCLVAAAGHGRHSHHRQPAGSRFRQLVPVRHRLQRRISAGVFQFQFLPVAISITDLYLYNTQFDSGATQTPTGTYTVNLSTTSAGVGTLSGTFADNDGGDKTQVFSGSINRAWNFGDTLDIHFEHGRSPMTRAGGNLLLDVVGNGISALPSTSTTM